MATRLPYDERAQISEDEAAEIYEDLVEYFQRWEDELQPILLEVELMATPAVADIADRVSGALMEITVEVERRGKFVDYYPGWFQAKDLLEVLHNAMRVELGLSEALLLTDHREGNWPWLDSRPSRESYVQHHPRSELSPQVETRDPIDDQQPVSGD
ncbi:hypothetical protein ABGB08_43335 [Acrocarpospora sp. B8E8]